MRPGVRRASALAATTLLVATSGWGFVDEAHATQLAKSDLNADSKADIFTRVGQSDTANTYLGDGATAFLKTVSNASHWSGADYAIPAPYFSGYGSDVIVRSHSDGTLRLFRASDGVASGGHQIGSGWSGMNSLVMPGDFSGDGHPDLLARQAATGNLIMYRGDGGGGWKGSVTVGFNWSAFGLLFSAGDFDGDGHVDVIGRVRDTGDLLLYRGNGSGGWRSSERIGHGWTGMNAIFSVGDFDRDGATDVIARRSDNGDLYLYRGSGRGTFAGSKKIGHNFSGVALPGAWPSSATTPLPKPGPLPRPKPPTKAQPFVYGTLRTGQRGYDMILRGKTTKEIKTTVASRDMYTKAGGAFPYSVPAGSARTIVGQEMWIRDADYWTILARLDRYENYDPSKPLTNQAYYRTTSTTARGTKIWIYDSTPRMADYLRRYGVRIPSGDWLNRNVPRAAMSAPAVVATNAAADFTVEDVTQSAMRRNEFGTFAPEHGTFVTLDLDVTFHGAKSAEYLPVLPQNVTIVDADGKTVPASSGAADDCMAGSELPDAFVDPGTTTQGSIVLDVDPERLNGATVHYQPLPGIDLSYEIAPQREPAPTEGSTPDSAGEED